MPSKVVSNVSPDLAIIRLRSGADRLIELTWLTAILMIPLIFQVIVWLPLIPGLDGIKLYSFLQPKPYLLHASALIILCLWVFDVSLAWTQRKGNTNPLSGFRDWLAVSLKDPVWWALLFTVLFLIGQLVSVLISPSPLISFIGRNQNEPGGDFYTQLSTLIVFIAIAVRVRRRQQIERILVAIAVCGLIATLYGFAQLFGIDPFGFSAGRIYSTLGNPIFYASFLLLSSLATLTWGWLQWDRKQTPLSAWIFGGSVVLTGIQAGSILLTASRGPTIGIFSSLFILAFLVIFYRQSGTQKLAAIGVLLISIVAWLVLWFGGGDIGSPIFIAGYSIVLLANLGFIYWKWRLKEHSALIPGLVVLIAQNVIFFTNGSSGFIEDYAFTVFLFVALGLLLLWNGGQEKGPRAGRKKGTSASYRWNPLKFTSFNDRKLIIVGSIGVIVAIALLLNGLVLLSSRTSSVVVIEDRIGRDLVVSEDTDLFSALNGISSMRLNIWNGAWQLIESRESVIDESAGLVTARHIFGNSQEMYYIGYPLTAVPSHVFEVSGHAHNQLLHILLELGIWGLVSFLGILGSVLAAMIMALVRLNSYAGSDRYSLIIICLGLITIFGARFIEQVPGVGRISDSFIFAVILGLGLAIYRISQIASSPDNEGASADVKPGAVQASRRVKGKSRSRQGGSKGWVPVIWGRFNAKIHVPISILMVMVVGSLWFFVQYDGSIMANSSKATDFAQLLTPSAPMPSVENYETLALRGQPLMEIYDDLYEIALDQQYEEVYAVDYARRITMIAVEYQRLGQGDLALELLNRGIRVLENVLEVSPFAVNPLVLLVNFYSTAYSFSGDQVYKDGVLETGQKIELLLNNFSSSLSELSLSYSMVNEFDAALRVANASIATGQADVNAYYTKGFAQFRISSEAGLPPTDSISSLSLGLLGANVDHPRFIALNLLLTDILRRQNDPVLQDLGGRFAALEDDISAIEDGSSSSQRQLVKGQILMLIRQNDLIQNPDLVFDWEDYDFVNRLERSSYYEPTDVYSQEASVVLGDHFESEGNTGVAMCYANRAAVQQSLLDGVPGASENDIRALDCREN